MVEVFKKGSRGKAVAFGEVVKDDAKTFKLHCSYIIFTKTEYYFENKLY